VGGINGNAVGLNNMDTGNNGNQVGIFTSVKTYGEATMPTSCFLISYGLAWSTKKHPASGEA